MQRSGKEFAAAKIDHIAATHDLQKYALAQNPAQIERISVIGLRVGVMPYTDSLSPPISTFRVPAMGKFKQFLIGALTGAGVVFVALQYHVVQTHQGFRVVPRTPQHSIGLAYADIRNWDAAKWADFPELARALVANGSTDLVAESVTEGLMESVSSNSPMDQLRGFLNGPSPSSEQSDPLMNAPGFLPIRKDTEDTPSSTFDDLFSTPFPLNPGQKPPGDSALNREPLRQTTVAKATNLDVDDVFRSGVSGIEATQKPVTNSISPAPAATSGRTAQQEADLIENMLFGDDDTNLPASEPGTNEGVGMFEDVTNALEARASDAMRKAAASVRNDTSQALQDSGASLDRYVRDQVKSVVPGRVSSMFSEDIVASPGPAINAQKPVVPEAIKALQNGFDPFLD